MGLSKKAKLHEWLAERISWIQYPNISPGNAHTKQASRTGYKFTYSMPIWDRIPLFFASTALLIVGLGIAGIILVFLYVIIKVVFT